MSENNLFDIVVIGGGINGVGIARDAAGRGLKVLLCEKDDLASGTSSASTKLIHGGLRYLEHKEFRLVKESLREREILLKSAPHIIWPLRFVLPHIEQLRSYWTVRAGLLLYDFLAGRKVLKKSKAINLKKHVVGAILEPITNQGFLYSDCWVQDARLVVMNAMDARQRGATILTRTSCMSARKNSGSWDLMLRNSETGKTLSIKTKAVVNATGPWINSVQQHVFGTSNNKKVRLVKGSHIVIPKVSTHDFAYIFQQDDRRIVFAIPFEGKFTLIGTTEENYSDDPSNSEISEQEIKYLMKAVNNYFRKKVTLDDIVWTYSGVRPLIGDDSNPSTISRDYQLELESKTPYLLSVYGGKITTYRKLAENALAKLGHAGKEWTAGATLPGGNFTDFNEYLVSFRKTYPWLSESLSYRYARNYGTFAEKIVGKAKSLNDLGKHLGDELYEGELDYLMRYEWVHTADDVLWRRTKLGLFVSLETRNNLKQWMEHNTLR